MKILTYPDPFALREEKEIWALLKSHPVYCASDTLVQGLSRYYGRSSFGIIRPIQDLMNAYLGPYVDNPLNDMQLYLTVSDLIRCWPDSPMKQSFLFNRSHVVQAIRLLIPLELDTSQIDQEFIDPEQRLLLSIYNEVKKSHAYHAFSSMKNKTIIDFETAVQCTSAEEILFALTDATNEAVVLGNGIDASAVRSLRRNNPSEFLTVSRRVGKILLNYYADEIMDEDRASQFEIALKGCTQQEEEYYKTIVICGVHRFTPEIYYLVQNLENRLHVEIIFVIPYVKDLPAVYDTWRRVYAWSNIPFENVKPLGSGYHIPASEMADVLSGKRLETSGPRTLWVYDNLTSFALSEVSNVYRRAYVEADKNNKSSALNLMDTQYYAVKSRDCNELLKMFYPEQFKEKRFLSYPIGQLILGLYRMWNFEDSRIHFDIDTLINCAVSGLFQPNLPVAPILRKLKPYFNGADTYEDYLQRLNMIQEFQQRASADSSLMGLKRLSFFSLSSDELYAMRIFLSELNGTAISLFKDKSTDRIDYVSHFRKLMDIISDAANSDTRMVRRDEIDLIHGIRERLSTDSHRYAEGRLEDVTEALAFFLAGQEDKNTSNWIVRDFEQIDGAVLLSAKSDSRKFQSHAEKYHFALLSNEHMLKKGQEELPWPLTVEMFDACTESLPGIRAFSTAIRERRGFLKFSLFYGTYFSQKELEFSYIRSENKEDQTPYYLFTAMGYNVLPKEENQTGIFTLLNAEVDQDSGKQNPASEEDKELFAICPYKYLLHSVLHTDVEYVSEYQFTYFLRYYLTVLGREKKNAGLTPRVWIENVVKEIRKYFPMISDATFRDLIRDAGNDLAKYPKNNPIIYRRKLNFLVAGWDGWDPDFKLKETDQIAQYMASSEIYPSDEKLPRNTLCEYCSFSGICLRDFYMEHDQEEGVVE